MRVMTRMRHEECPGNGTGVKHWRETRVAFVEVQRANSCIGSVSDAMMECIVHMVHVYAHKVICVGDLEIGAVEAPIT